MEQSPSWYSVAHGTAETSALLIFFASFTCVCVALFGEQLPALYLGVPAGCTLVLFAGLRLQRTSRIGRGFTLDDQARAIIPRSGRPIPYRAIAHLRMVLFRDLACIYALCGPLRRQRALACVSRPGPVQDILQALCDRNLTVRVSRNPFKKRAGELLPLIIMPLLAAAILFVNIDMQRRFPGLALPPQKLSVEAPAPQPGYERHYLEPFSFALPGHYRVLESRDRSVVLYSSADSGGLVLNTLPTREIMRDRPLLQQIARLLGFAREHDAAMLAVRSRLGLLPALIKSTMISTYNPEMLKIYYVKGPLLSGVMLLGEQRPREDDKPDALPDQVAEIVLRCADSQQILRIRITSRLPIDTGFIERLLAGTDTNPLPYPLQHTEI